MYQTEVVANGIRTLFGGCPSADGKKSPFLDARVRQAYSMAMNRDLWIEVVYNTDNYKKGLPVDTRWNTALVADVFEGWWLDPKSKDFGPNASFYQHNVAEAKKLLSAAGYTTVEMQSHIVSSGFGPDFLKLVEILEGFVAEAGFKLTPHLTDYNTDYIPNYRDSSGKFSGVAYKSGPAPAAADAVARLEFDYTPRAATTGTASTSHGKGDFSGRPVRRPDDCEGEGGVRRQEAPGAGARAAALPGEDSVRDPAPGRRQRLRPRLAGNPELRCVQQRPAHANALDDLVAGQHKKG